MAAPIELFSLITALRPDPKQPTWLPSILTMDSLLNAQNETNKLLIEKLT
jgi:hypothetical protein